jgi:hypothetical protein
MMGRVPRRTARLPACVVMLTVLSVLLSTWSGAVGQSPGVPDDPCGQAGLLDRLVAVAPLGSSVVEASQYSGQQWSDLFSQGSTSEQLGAEALRSYAARLGQVLGDLCIVSMVLIDATGAYSEVKAVSGGSVTMGLLDGAPAIFGATPGAQMTTVPGTDIPTVSWIDQYGQPFQAIEAGGAVWIARQGDLVLANIMLAAPAPSEPPEG